MERVFHKTLIVCAAAVEVISTASGHFENASTAMRNILATNGPAKSKYILTHGLDGHIHGCNGEQILEIYDLADSFYKF